MASPIRAGRGQARRDEPQRGGTRDRTVADGWIMRVDPADVARAGVRRLRRCRGLPTESLRLTELRLLAEDERLAAMLRPGEVHRVVAEAEALLASEPLRERRWVVLIYAPVHRRSAGRCTGRVRTSAQAASRGARRGPGAELRRVYAAALAHDRALLILAGVLAELPPAFLVGGPLFVGRDRELATCWIDGSWRRVAVAGCPCSPAPPAWASPG